MAVSRPTPTPTAGAKTSRDEIKSVVEGVVSTLHGGFTASDLKLYEELESLIAYIHSAKREIAALCPDEIKEKHIREATDELDAIVAHTENATGGILDCAEKIETIAGELSGDPAAKLAEQVTRIYEACNFQDITGQRINKVVTTLKNIEERIKSLASALGGQRGMAQAPVAPAAPSKHGDEAGLLNGPQLPTNAKSQDEVDALLKSFD